MQVTSKDFKKISIRGRVGYGICCLENVLEKYKISGQGWYLLLEKLWTFTSLPSEMIPVKGGGVEFLLEKWAEINYVAPYNKYFYNSFDYNDLCAYCDFYNENKIVEEEYDLLREAYQETNDIITHMVSLLVSLGMSELWSNPNNFSPETLEHLQSVIDFMDENNIPLPDIEPFKQYEYSPKGIDEDSFGWGYTFDGKQYSKFLNKIY